MSQDLEDVIQSLDRWLATVRHSMIPALQRAEYAADDAYRTLLGIDDGSAREAAALASHALDDLRNVIYGTLPDYERMDAELRRRIAEA